MSDLLDEDGERLANVLSAAMWESEQDCQDWNEARRMKLARQLIEALRDHVVLKLMSER